MFLFSTFMFLGTVLAYCTMALMGILAFLVVDILALVFIVRAIIRGSKCEKQ